MAPPEYPYTSEYWRPLTGTLQLVSLMAVTLMVKARLPGRDVRGRAKRMGLARWALLVVLANS